MGGPYGPVGSPYGPVGSPYGPVGGPYGPVGGPYTFGSALADSVPHTAVALPVAKGSVPAGPPALAV
ncbi:hypothetical protein SY2F82_06300 [Streptomyces sp. Y2F8-2]|nr:hypothetical protein SY2F82_06300 [Streptomyces sp. Y2F8-2]